MPMCGKVEPLLLRYPNHYMPYMQQEQVSRPICGKVGSLLFGYTYHLSKSKYWGQYVIKWDLYFLDTLIIKGGASIHVYMWQNRTTASWTHSSSQQEQVFGPLCGKVEPLLLRYTYHHMQQEQVFRPICGKVGPLLLGYTHHHSRSKYSGQYGVKWNLCFLDTLILSWSRSKSLGQYIVKWDLGFLDTLIITAGASIQANMRQNRILFLGYSHQHSWSKYSGKYVVKWNLYFLDTLIIKGGISIHANVW